MVEERANVRFDYVFVPWDQAMRLVRTGAADAAFNSSYKEERAAFGDYPLKDGEPDAARATNEYSYHLYAREGAGITWDGERVSGLDEPAVVEKSAAIIGELDKRNIPYREVADNEAMLSLLVGRRAKAMVGIGQTVDAMIAEEPVRFADLEKLDPPLQYRVGYLMFSKPFCASEPEVCETVWDAIGEVRQTDTFKAIRLSYENE